MKGTRWRERKRERAERGREVERKKVRTEREPWVKEASKEGGMSNDNGVNKNVMGENSKGQNKGK